MASAIELLIEAANKKLDQLGLSDAEIWDDLRAIPVSERAEDLAQFGEFIVDIINAPVEAHFIDRVDVLEIFDKAVEAAGPGETAEAINALWASIEKEIPEPEFIGHQAEDTGRYGR
jgi:hypothetical protein